ncbi:MAG TPA: hypothetical protein VHZ51_31895, partial [Ktedonobacteraceae bacterium]|nr:hypothetical protein [Ktedonobacteraceae bacterium]
GRERYIALFLTFAMFLLLLLAVVGLIASYLPQNSSSFQPHAFNVLPPLLGSLAFGMYLLFSSQDLLRQPLPVTLLAGLVLGSFLGSIFNLPYYLGLLLIFGMFGPGLALNSPGASGLPNPDRLLDFWLSIVAVLLSLFLYALVAFLITRRTGLAWQGKWAAFLAAFISLLVATLTFVLIALVHAFPISSQELLPTMASFQYLPLQTMPLAIAQAIHATLGGFIGSAIGLRMPSRIGSDRRKKEI